MWSDSLPSADLHFFSNIHSRLDKGNAPWADYKEATKQSILPAMKALGFEP